MNANNCLQKCLLWTVKIVVLVFYLIHLVWILIFHWHYMHLKTTYLFFYRPQTLLKVVQNNVICIFDQTMTYFTNLQIETACVPQDSARALIEVWTMSVKSVLNVLFGKKYKLPFTYRSINLFEDTHTFLILILVSFLIPCPHKSNDGLYLYFCPPVGTESWTFVVGLYIGLATLNICSNTK